MVQDVLLYFMEDGSSTTDEGFVAKASDFLAMEIVNAGKVKLSFRGGQDRDSVNTVTLTVADLAAAWDGTGSNPNFRNISEVVGSLLNADKDKYFVVADEETGTYIDPVFTSVVTVANAID